MRERLEPIIYLGSLGYAPIDSPGTCCQPFFTGAMEEDRELEHHDCLTAISLHRVYRWVSNHVEKKNPGTATYICRTTSRRHNRALSGDYIYKWSCMVRKMYDKNIIPISQLPETELKYCRYDAVGKHEWQAYEDGSVRDYRIPEQIVPNYIGIRHYKDPVMNSIAIKRRR